jgi:uncharacterized membrane protein
MSHLVSAPLLTAILTLALAVDGTLRFHRLGKPSMTADEGAAWAAASEPSLAQLVEEQPAADPGKLVLYDVVLHEWIRFFGDRLQIMRGLSAGIDTLSIVLVFLVVRELFLRFDADRDRGGLAGSFAALMYAFNNVMIDSGRTARMYSPMLACLLAHLFFFVRSQRTGAMRDYAPCAVFLALAISFNFTAIFILLSEGLWMAYVLLAKWRESPGKDLRVVGPGLAVTAGLALLAPFVQTATKASSHALEFGYLKWIKNVSAFWPYTALQNAVGPIFILLLG